MPIYVVHRVLTLDAQARALCFGAFAILAQLDSSRTDLHLVGPLAAPFAIADSSAFAFIAAEALPLPDIDGPSSSRSSSYVTTDEEDDCLYGYKVPFTKGSDLRIINRRGQLWCPICPGRADWAWTKDAVRNHVLGLGSPSSSADPKKRSRHRALAGNEGWLPSLSNAATEEEDDEDDDALL